MSGSSGDATNSVAQDDSQRHAIDSGFQLTIPVIVLGGAFVAFVVFSLLGGVLRRAYLRRRKLDLNEEFRGPFWVWLYILTGSPLLVALVGILVSAGVSFKGVVDSGYTMNIDMDVANYMRADSELMRVQTALQRAVENQDKTVPSERRLGEEPRRLVQMAAQSVWYWTLDVYYESTDGGTIFTADALEEMRAFERDLLSFPDYERYCLKDRGACVGSESVTNVFFSTQTQSDQSHVLTTYNGEGTLQNIRETLERFARTGVRWWTDNTFSATNLESQYTRSRFRGGVPLQEGDLWERLPQDRKTSGVWLKKLHNEFLLKVNDGRYQHIVISWQEKEHLYSYEVMETLWHDCRWSIGAFAFVVGFVAIQVRSLFLTFAAMIGVLLSFSTGYYFYYSVAGYHEMNLVNFIALFLVTGIAADDILVMFNTYELSTAVVALEAKLQPVDRMLWTYYRAGGAMLVTTATTCGSFFSLGISSLFVVRRFGFFMGTVVALNYVHVMVIFPSLLLVKEMYWPVFLRICCCRRAPRSDEGDSGHLELPLSPESPRPQPTSDTTDPVAEGSKKTVASQGSTASLTGNKKTVTTQGSASSLTNNKKTSSSHVSKLFLEKRSVDSLNVKHLGPFARCFRGPFYWIIQKTRYLLIVVVLATSGISAWRAAEDITAAKGLPQVFVTSRNVGRLLELVSSTFTSYAEADLNTALSTFSRTNGVLVPVCPKGDNGERCSGHGTCNTLTSTCSCVSPYFGTDCANNIRGPVLTAQPASLRLPVIGKPGEPYSGNVIIREVLILNDGDEATAWSLSQPSEPWLTLSPMSGSIGQRSIVGGIAVPTTAVLELRADLNGRALGWNSTQTLALQGTGGATPGSLVVDVGVVEGPELLYLLPLPGSVPLNSLSAATLADPPVTLVPSFSGQRKSYSAALDYRDSSARVLVAFEAPTVSARVDGNQSQIVEMMGYTGAVSGLIDLEVGASRQVRVEAVSKEAVVGVYLLTLTRGRPTAPGPVSLQRVFAADRSLTVVFAPPASDGGTPITGYEMDVVPVSSRRLLSGRRLAEVAGCTPTPCWTHKLGEQAGNSCCEHRITGLQNGVAHTVTIRAVNSEGSGQLSVPVLSEWPWLPVTPRTVPLAPSINAAPLVDRQHGEVDLSIDPSSVIQGDAVPLGDYFCSAAPGNANASGRSPVTIKGLDPDQTYTFTCSFTNARPNPAGGATSSAASPATPPTNPNVPAPPAPNLTGVSLRAGVLTVSVVVGDVHADWLNCSASNSSGDAIEVGVALSGPTQRDVQLVVPQADQHGLACNVRNLARGRSVAQLWGPPSQTLEVPPAPAAPRLAAAPTRGGAGVLDITLEPLADDGFGPLGNFSCTATSPGLPERISQSESTSVRISGMQSGAFYSVTCTVDRPVPGMSGSFATSEPSMSSDPVLVGTAPPAPTIVDISVDSAGPTALVAVGHVSFTPPVSQYSCAQGENLQNATTLNVTTAASIWTVSVPVPDAEPNVVYSFFCWAVNAIGTSAPSSAWMRDLFTATTTTSKTSTLTATSTTETVTVYTSVTTTTVTTVTSSTSTSTTPTSTTTTSTTPTSTITTTTTFSTTTVTTTRTTSTTTTFSVTSVTATTSTFTTITVTTVTVTTTSVTATSNTATSTTATTTTATTSTVTTDPAVTITTTVTPDRGTVQGFLDLQTGSAADLETQAGRDALIQAIAAITGVPPGQISISVTVSGGRRLDGHFEGGRVVVVAASTRRSWRDQEGTQGASSALAGVSARRLVDSVRVDFTIVVNSGSETGVQSDLDSAGATGMTSAINTALTDASIDLSVDVQTSTATVTSSTTSTSTASTTSTSSMTISTSSTTTATTSMTSTSTTTATTSTTSTTTRTSTTTTATETTTQTQTTTGSWTTSSKTITVTQSTTTSRTTTTSSLTTSTSSTTTATMTSSTLTTLTSTTSSTTTPEPPIPLAPTVLNILVSGHGQATLLLDSGGDISIKEANCSVVEEPRYLGTSSSLSVVLSGLPAGGKFTFRCAVRNVAGWSPYGDATSPHFTVAVRPAAPQVSSVVVAGDRQLAIHVAVSDDGGSPVLRTTCNSVLGTTVEATSNGTQVTVQNLSAGVGYTFQCRVESAAGSSDPSAASQMVTAVMPPQTPKVVCTVPKSAEVVVQVQLPSSDPRFAEETSVSCSTSTGTEVEWPVVDRTNIEPPIRNLPNGVSVQVSCFSRSVAGDSPRSQLSQAVTPGVPVIGTFGLRQSSTSDEQVLRSWLAGELSADLSAVVADVALDGQGFDGCVAGTASQSPGRRLQEPERFDLQVKVFVPNEQDPSVPNLLRGLNSFSGPSSPLAARTSSRVSLLQAPYVATAAHTDSTLQSLTVQAGDSSAALPLVPPFSPLVKLYEVNLTNKSFSVRAEPSSQLASPPESEDGQSLPASFESSVLSPNYTSVAVKVTAADMTSSTYYLRAFLPPQSCGDCGNGTCNVMTGFCDCHTNYTGSSCLAYCPGQPLCGGRGVCSLSTNNCQCEETFAGPDCSVRACPSCQNGGVCQEGTQDRFSEWTCECPASHTGSTCAERRCPNDCSGAGECNQQTGECTCFSSHEGDDCSQEMMVLVPLKHCVEVSLVWGMSGYDSLGDPVYDEDFRFELASTQEWLLEVCRLARLSPMVRSEQPCFIETFRNHLNREQGGPGFPLTNQTKLPGELLSFMNEQDRPGKGDVGTTSTRWEGQVRYVRQRLRFNVHKTSTTPRELQEEYNKWLVFVDNVNSRAEAGLRMKMVSNSWTQLEVELGILNSTVVAFAVSVAVSLLAVLLFTGNVLLSLYTVLTTVLVIATLFGIVTSVLKWEFGAVQAIGMTTFVGMSVDYTLHLSHAYHSSKGKRRGERAKDALVHLGPAVLGGATTTAGAAGFLFPCWIYLFHQLGVMLCINAVVALIYSFMFLVPVLMTGGPTGRCCNLYAFLCPARWCGGEESSDDTIDSPRDVTSPRRGDATMPPEITVVDTSAPSPKADARPDVEENPLLAHKAKEPAAVSSGAGPPPDVGPTEDDVAGVLV